MQEFVGNRKVGKPTRNYILSVDDNVGSGSEKGSFGKGVFSEKSIF